MDARASKWKPPQAKRGTIAKKSKKPKSKQRHKNSGPEEEYEAQSSNWPEVEAIHGLRMRHRKLVASCSVQRSPLTNTGRLPRFDKTAAAHHGPLGTSGKALPGQTRGPCLCRRTGLGLEPDVSRLLSGPES
ncbi:hypothetical protein J3F83DRAFT_160454 [Trichoderma novae-zelandiae]